MQNICFIKKEPGPSGLRTTILRIVDDCCLSLVLHKRRTEVEWARDRWFSALSDVKAVILDISLLASWVLYCVSISCGLLQSSLGRSQKIPEREVSCGCEREPHQNGCWHSWTPNLISTCTFVPRGLMRKMGASLSAAQLSANYGIYSNAVICWAVFKILFYF